MTGKCTGATTGRKNAKVMYVLWNIWKAINELVSTSKLRSHKVFGEM